MNDNDTFVVVLNEMMKGQLIEQLDNKIVVVVEQGEKKEQEDKLLVSSVARIESSFQGNAFFQNWA